MMFFRGWHPEGAIRYLPVVDEIQRLGKTLQKQPTILEVGSGEWGIVPYLGSNVDAVDPAVRNALTEKLHFKKGTATKLPFDHWSYDVVFSVDLLEHLPKNDRQEAVDEHVRVAKHLVVIAVPCGKDALRHDSRMDLLWQFWRKTGHEPMMAEHAQYGLPECEDVTAMIRRAMKKYGWRGHVRVEKNLNIAIRQFLIQWWIMPWKWSYYFYLKGLLPIVTFRKFLNVGSCYRCIFICTRAS